MKKLFSALIVSLLVLNLLNSPILAQESQQTILNPSADATVVEADGTNFGSEVSLLLENGESYKSFYVKFDVSVIPSDAVIQSATLSFHQISVVGSTNISVYKVLTSWNEGSISGTNTPGVSDQSLGNLSSDFSSLVQTWVTGSTANEGFYIAGEKSGAYALQYSSREGVSKPELTITYTVSNGQGPVLSNIKIVKVTENSATISWTTDKIATSFIDYAKTEDFGQVAGSNKLVTSHSVTLSSLASETTYFFRVRSGDNTGHESYSESMAFKTLEKQEEVIVPKTDENVSEDIPSPQNFKLTSTGDESGRYVLLEWDEPDTENIEGYKIYRSSDDNISYEFLAQIDPENTEYKDRDIKVGTTYFYVVRTLVEGKESKDSDEKSITVFGSKIGEQLSKINFWRGFLIFNLIFAPVFAVWYVLFRKKRRKLKGKGKKQKQRKKK